LLLTPYEQNDARFHDDLLLTDQEHTVHDHHNTFHELLIGASVFTRTRPHISNQENTILHQMLDADDPKSFAVKSNKARN
jgi:hypothetical protein